MRQSSSKAIATWGILALLAHGTACSDGVEGEAAPTTSLGPSNGTVGQELDLILVTVDTLRADRMPMYGGSRPLCGHPEDPWTISWLAAQGTLIEEVHAQVGITLPSVATLWTGLHPLVHGALTNQSRLEAGTFAEELSGMGYDGVGAVANGILRAGSGLERGFREYRAFKDHREHEMPSFLLEEAEPTIAEGRKLLLWAHFMTPHQPYAPPDHYAGRYSNPDGPKGNNRTLYEVHLDPEKLTPELKEHLRGLYDEEILAANDLVQELLAGLDQAYRNAGRGGLLENAVVVFTSDHGEELGDRNGFFMHAKSLYAGVTHVPTFVIGPGWRAAREPQLMGLDELLPLVLHGSQPSGSPVISSLKEKFYAVRDAEWTLIHNPRDDGSSPGGPPRGSVYPYPTVALFHRATDPLELSDLAGEEVGRARDLLDYLRDWHQGIQVAGEAASGVDPALLDSLGYASTESSPGEAFYPPPWRGADWRPEED